MLKRELASSLEPQSPGTPFKTGRDMFAKYGPAPSAEEIDASSGDVQELWRRLLMIATVADTHTAPWHLLDDPRLIASISLAEVVYLVEKGRLPPSAYEELTEALADPEHVFTEAVLTYLLSNPCGESLEPKFPICRTESW